MYSLPISDTTAVAIDDTDDDLWWVHFIDFDAKTFETFSVTGMGTISFAHYDRIRGTIWLITNGTVFIINRKQQQIFEAPPPPKPFFVYSIVGEAPYLYFSGEYSNLWRLSIPGLEWEPLRVPDPPPPTSDDEQEQTRRVTDYAGKYPPYYAGFQRGDDYFFCGALGAIARVRGTSVETTAIDTGSRLVKGRVEGKRISVSADGPRGEIYLGDFDDGFELVFADNLPAFHLTAIHEGRRYLGVGNHPPSDVHNLYILDGAQPVKVEPGVGRDPFPLISLTSTGSSLWAIDEAGLFRLSNAVWTLVDVTDLRSGTWPETG